MNQHVSEMLGKLKSDRLWAALGFVVLVLVNAKFHWIADEQIKQVMWVAISFVLGKSIRGTPIGDAIESVAGGLLKTTTKVETKVQSTGPRDPSDLP